MGAARHTKGLASSPHQQRGEHNRQPGQGILGEYVMESIIRSEGLTRRFGAKTVVDHLDMAIPAGAIFVLLGDNGAGKSTTIRMLMGLLPADAGRASILGEDCWTAAIRLRHRVGYVPEKPRYYDWMTVGEIGWFTSGFHRTGFLDRYNALVEHFHMDRTAKLKTLSKGGYAKVGLALALAPEPEVLVLDEPTSGLDLFTRREFLASMVDLAGAGRTILISSHGIAEVERVASHVAFLAHGRLLLAAPLEELRQRLVRLRLRWQGSPPVGAELGTVLDEELSGPQWQVVLQDPRTPAVARLRHRAGITDFEEVPLSLEEMYTSLLAKYHGAGPAVNGHAKASAAVPVEQGGD
jgi:ABC-2 type transport system ATP-binding protein